jgi:class 3 adenylate cyclase
MPVFSPDSRHLAYAAAIFTWRTRSLAEGPPGCAGGILDGRPPGSSSWRHEIALRVGHLLVRCDAILPRMTPETQYARVGELYLAYQTVGEGAIDLVLADQWMSHQEAQWDVAPLAEVRRRLADIGRLILFDKRGVGMSDPVPIQSLPSIEAWIDDVRAVMDAARSDRAALITTLGGGLMGLVFAATHPDRLRALVVVDGWARARAAPDYPVGLSSEDVRRRVEQTETGWGRGVMLDSFAPSMRAIPGLREAWGRYERFAASPGVARAMISNLLELDVRHVLSAIHVPTLVIQHADAAMIGPGFGRYIAERIAGARYVELPGIDNLIWAGDQAAIVAEIESFVTGARSTRTSDRRLATVLFTDIVGSTRRAAAVGDHAWRELLDRHDELVRSCIERAGGHMIKTTGDGVLATFDGPGRALEAAREISTTAPKLDLHLRAGLHAGEIEVTRGDVIGLAVHVAARVAALAGSDEVLVSSTVRDLVVGSGLAFADRGSRVLKGVPGRWRLYAAEFGRA